MTLHLLATKLNSTTGRLLVAAVCIAATEAAVWRLNYGTALAAARSADFDVTALPFKLGDWSGTETELDPRLFQKIGALSMVNRSYENNLGQQVSLHVGSFPTAETNMLHLPSLCYTLAGWTILKDEWQHDSHDRRYRLMIIEQNGARAAVVYWFQLGPDVSSNRDDLRPILQKLRWQGKAWPPFVKVLIHIPLEFSDESAKPLADGLGAEIYKWIESASAAYSD